MKQIIYTLALGVTILMGACTKNNDYIKSELEKALPTIEITSLGLASQVGPYATTDVIQATFGGALTNAEPGSLSFAWYTTTGTPTLVDSVYFDKWTVAASAATANNAVTTRFMNTTYANTTAYSGNLNLRLAKLTGGNRSYTLRVYVRTAGNEMATVAVSRFVTIK